MALLNFNDSLFLQKKIVCLYHIWFLEILGPNISLIFHSNFHLDVDPFSSLVLDMFNPHLYKTLDLIGSIFYCIIPYQKFVEVSPVLCGLYWCFAYLTDSPILTAYCHCTCYCQP